MIGLTALAMGLRNAIVRRVKVLDLTTTVLTLIDIAGSSPSGGENRNWGRCVAAVVATFVGAVIGALLVRMSGLIVPLVITGAVVLVVTLANAAHPASRAKAAGPEEERGAPRGA